MRNKVFLPRVHATKRSTFFKSTDPKNHKCLIEFAENRPNKADGSPRPAIYHSVSFRGKLAEIAALMFTSGKPMVFEGYLDPYLKDTGRVDTAGKKVMEWKFPIVCTDWDFAGESAKSIAGTITANIARGKTEGVIAPQTNIGAEYLLVRETTNKHRPYNDAEVLATGRFGNARVWEKGKGWLGPQNVVATGPATPVVGTEPILGQAEVEALKKELTAKLAELKGAQAGAVNPLADDPGF